MEKAILTSEQLNVLMAYISKRSPRFAEPVVMREILDHFACKVEDLLTAKPNLDFQQAMVQAHKSFGVKGFGPIADHVTESFNKKYRRIAVSEMKKVLISFHTLGIAAVGLLIYLLVSGLLKILPAGLPFYIYDLPLAGFVVSALLIQRKKMKALKNYKLLSLVALQANPAALVSRNFFGYFTLMGLCTVHSSQHEKSALVIMPILGMFALFSLIVEKRLIDIAEKEASEMEYQRQSIA